MTFSQNRLRNRFLGGLAIALTLGFSGAWAQSAQPSEATGAPQALPGMQELSQPVAPAAPSAPDASSPSAPTSMPPPPQIMGHSSGSAITISSLGQVEGPPTGTLDNTNGGLGMDLWSGSDRATVAALMARLPIATPIASIRALARRIVLTKAITPSGVAPQAFMTVRIQALLRAGLLADAGNLAAMADVKNNPGFARAQAEALLYDNQKAHICDDTTATRFDSSDPFWIKIRAYCYAVGGNDAALSLTRSVMQAQNIDSDTFETLLHDIQHNVAKDPGNIDAPTALDAFLLQQAGLGVSFDTGAQLGTPGLLLAMRNTQNSPEQRMRAAERLVRSGAVSAEALTAIADAQHFTANQFATEHAQLGRLPFLMGQALLRQAVMRASPQTQPALIDQALRHAEAKGLLRVGAILQNQALAQLTPQPALHDMIGLFARALMMTGHGAAADRWIALLDTKRDPDRQLRAKLAVMLDFTAPNPSRAVAGKDGLNVLAADVANMTPNAGFGALALGLAATFNKPMSAKDRNVAAAAMDEAWPGRRAAPSLMRRLEAALSASGERGQALMLALNAIGPNGPGDMAPDAVVTIVRALMHCGVAGAAHDIAVSALLRYRPPPPPPPKQKAAAPPPQ